MAAWFDEIEVEIEIVELLASPVHRYQGRSADGPVSAPDDELRDHLELRAGLGIVGDRYFNQRAHRASSVTIQAAESLEALARTMFSLDSGDGEVRFGDARPANPCAWMDTAIGEGAHRAFRRRGGLRAGPLDDGMLRLGPAALRVTSLVE